MLQKKVLMKVSKPPSRFFPDRAFTTEDVNRNLSHAANMIKNDQDERYVYSSIRIPCSIFSGKQTCGPTTMPSGAVPATANKTLLSGNHEAIRMFSFVPPFDMKLVSTDFYVKGGSETKDQISKSTPMVAKVQWVVEDGGEGFPPKPKSYLPEGMTPSGNIDLTRIHDQITINIEEDKGFYTSTDNGEYTLRAGKCYRVMVSDPDIPYLETYSQSWYWRYKMAWIQLNFKYDKWQFDKIDRPDVTFKSAKDKVEQANSAGTGISQQVNALNYSRNETASRKKYPKPELHYFGIGNLNGYWGRPTSAALMDKATLQSDTATTGMTGDTTIKHAIMDMDTKYENVAGDKFLGSKWAHNFQWQAVWRSPMAAEIADVSRGKEIWGYSVGFAHNTSRNGWSTATTASMSDLRLSDIQPGYMFHAALGHGLTFNQSLVGSAPRNYRTYENNVVDPTAPQQRQPSLRDSNITDGGGLYVAPGGSTNILYRNDTIRGSTAIPETIETSADPRSGNASGFPGDYLAEIHSGTQYGNDPDNPPNATATQGDLSVGQGTFSNPGIGSGTAMVPGVSANQDLQDELWTIFHTRASGNETTPASNIQLENATRNFQKIYVLLWVL
jgi:hypothetical protein